MQPWLLIPENNMHAARAKYMSVQTCTEPAPQRRPLPEVMASHQPAVVKFRTCRPQAGAINNQQCCAEPCQNSSGAAKTRTVCCQPADIASASSCRRMKYRDVYKIEPR